MGWQDRAYNRDTSDHDMFPRFTGRSVTFWLIIINVVVFVVDALLTRVAQWDRGLFFEWWHFSAATLVKGQVWRLVTYQFLHGGLFHILFNMLWLYWFGRMVESFLGPRRYLAFYLLCGVGGALLYLVLWGLGSLTQTPNIPFLLFNDADTPMVGASAGIFGVMMAAAYIAPHQQISLIFPPITVQLRTLAYVLVAIAAFIVMVGGPNVGGEAAHLGGAILGFFLIRYPRPIDVFERLGMPRLKKMKQNRWMRQQEKLQRRQAAEDAEVDRILDKVRDHGLHSLSRSEKKILQRATERQRRAG